MKKKGRDDGRWRMDDCLGCFLGVFRKNGNFNALIVDTYTTKNYNKNTSITRTHRDVMKDDTFCAFGVV